MARGKRKSQMDPGEVAPNAAEEQESPRYLAYGLPRDPNDRDTYRFTCDGFLLSNAPLRALVSFLDFDGVALFASAFEKWEQYGVSPPVVSCVAPSDLDLRAREFYTSIEDGRTVCFLVPTLPRSIEHRRVPDNLDLFRRVLRDLGIDWDTAETARASVDSAVPEFDDFIRRYGAAHVYYALNDDHRTYIKPLCKGGSQVFGLIIAGKVFIVPIAFPQTQDQAVKMAASAIQSAIAYRQRISHDLPEWVKSFQFGKESCLRDQAKALQQQLAQIESQVAVYEAYKGALCFQSDPLVDVVSKILREFFDISLKIDEKRIEDASLQDENGKILAVFEIKGVNRSFKREDVNQVDSHRERLNLDSRTPGVLIMNTIMSAKSLTEKDQAPHPDITKKAVADNVLLMRTLDLLRYADAVEKGTLSKEQFGKLVLSEAGWLSVADGKVAVVKK